MLLWYVKIWIRGCVSLWLSLLIWQGALKPRSCQAKPLCHFKTPFIIHLCKSMSLFKWRGVCVHVGARVFELTRLAAQ